MPCRPPLAFQISATTKKTITGLWPYYPEGAQFRLISEAKHSVWPD